MYFDTRWVAASVCSFGLLCGEPASAVHLWKNTKSYSAYVGAGGTAAALAAAKVAKDAITAATADLAAAEAALAAAETAAKAGTTLANFVALEAAVAKAAAVLATAKTVAAGVAAVAAGATAGTVVGQGANWVLSSFWDPVGDPTSNNIGSGPVYVPASDSEIAAAFEEVTDFATNGVLPHALTEFSDAGVDPSFVTDGIELFIGSVRGAAAYTDGRIDEAQHAIRDLMPVLSRYRNSTEEFSFLLAESEFTFDQASFNDVFDEVLFLAGKIIIECDATAGDDCAKMMNLIDGALTYLEDMKQNTDELSGFDLDSSSSALIDKISLLDFQNFIDAVADSGASALPEEEIEVVDYLLAVSNVFVPGHVSADSLIAEWVAEGDILGREAMLFDPPDQSLYLSELIFRTATVSSFPCCNEPWLMIDLRQSPLYVPLPASFLLLFASIMMFFVPAGVKSIRTLRLDRP